eukprot:6214222-Pleurochrysis_carterae.AAC.1
MSLLNNLSASKTWSQRARLHKVVRASGSVGDTGDRLIACCLPVPFLALVLLRNETNGAEKHQ